MSEISDFLRELRGKMSLREASQKSGLSHTYISALEQNKRPGSNSPINPSPESLKRLSEAYRYPYEDLMKKAGYLEVDEVEAKESREPIEKFIDYLELELTDEEIIERMDFKIDNMVLDNDDIREFIAFVRAKRFMKTQQSGSSKIDKN